MRFLPPVFLAILMLGACSHTVPLSSKNASPAKNTLSPTNNRLYVVFFPIESTSLDDAANKTIRQAVDYARNFPDKQITVKGYAAVYKDLSQDELLAIQRAKVVTQQIIQQGIAADRVHDTPRPPEERKSQVAARRVEIQIQ